MSGLRDVTSTRSQNYGFLLYGAGLGLRDKDSGFLIRVLPMGSFPN